MVWNFKVEFFEGLFIVVEVDFGISVAFLDPGSNDQCCYSASVIESWSSGACSLQRVGKIVNRLTGGL